ncbi:YicC/YloC family endoribonuclease [Enterococcus mundtii]|uniref:YicC family protein n=1 Tax=Enterococcus mundtii TaxID=53346 RepID=A0A242KVG0_ENTMU|nr:YicC/YloC family endoribonuclease [Enterococcus mundtii]GEN17884.1 YicC family protein [Ligilactobacillus acidipiscis]AUB53864.1 YicC family protein [Enterococcus mundtii]MZZ59168.1 YicC family protein [Enterococcus mundtii]MZZ62166.1 YicC family protein [Enterococcus mundtii]MZZ69246.1 YicC family protein [Enterococcus mundtii]
MKSMTGFGNAIREKKNYQLEIEIKSVNQRFLDIQIRSPKVLGFVENELRQLIKTKLSRGRVDVFINLTYLGEQDKKVTINWQLIDTLYTQMTTGIKERYGEANALSIGKLIERFALNEEFVTIAEATEEDQELLAQLAKETMQTALRSIEESRSIEGQALANVLLQQAAELKQNIAGLASFVEIYEQEFQTRYQEKLEAFLGAEVERDRLLTEIAILLERGDIHEEIDRLIIHTQKLEELLEADYPIGRELDFLLQEMNREINTIGSKSSAIEIKNHVVQSKTILEKIREQIQNIE